MTGLPYIIRKLVSSPSTAESETTKNIYLTFDDGPIPEVTEFVVDELNKIKASATFFCLGKNIEENPAIFNKLTSNKNFTIGNHTCNHLNGWKTRNKEYYEDIFNFKRYYETKLFRPPYGKLTLSQLFYLKRYYRIYLWTLLSFDYDKNTSEEKCLNNVIKNAKADSIIVFHDSVKASKNLYYTLPRAIEYLSEKQFTFKAL